MPKSKNPLENAGVAHQYIRRLEKGAEEWAGNPYWLNVHLDLKNSFVEEVSLPFARKMIEEYEYLGCIAAVNFHQYGIFFRDKCNSEKAICGGVVIFGQEYAENKGVWDKYGYTGRIILLNRGVCLHWTPKGTNSHLISEAIKQLPSKYEVVTATVDPDAGEVGTIYQACNWNYVGALRKAKTRENYIINGKKYGSRSIRQKWGTTTKGLLEDAVKKELGEDVTVERVIVHAKHRYFHYRGDKRTKRKNIKTMKDNFKPYPKRIT